ncbi:hypothetical protein [Thermofilum pendens]|uniref:Uncharacterized protein n=1 Tax=Thermofilum pendens (strain DSM 2475 / Hrk 5) TaxID=368408 RepID=A1S0W6_THEPD|nr:hypothetical protein [Thermofilum pendens]ABL79096.1 hypothetical protein Tpen_1701 [Thermofilum pendens Hrk 5]
MAEVEVKGRKWPVLVAEVDAPVPLLGVYALETLGLRVNPTTGELEEVSPEGGYLLVAGLMLSCLKLTFSHLRRIKAKTASYSQE